MQQLCKLGLKTRCIFRKHRVQYMGYFVAETAMQRMEQISLAHVRRDVFSFYNMTQGGQKCRMKSLCHRMDGQQSDKKVVSRWRQPFPAAKKIAQMRFNDTDFARQQGIKQLFRMLYRDVLRVIRHIIIREKAVPFHIESGRHAPRKTYLHKCVHVKYITKSAVTIGTDSIMEWRGLRKIKHKRICRMMELNHVWRPGNYCVITYDIEAQPSHALLSHMNPERKSAVLRCPDKYQRVSHSQVDSVLEDAVDAADRPPGEECRKLSVNLLPHDTRRI